MHETQVIKNIEDTEDTFTLLLEKPEGFTFKPGQFLVLQLDIDQKPVRRSYSIASSPDENHISVTVKVQEKGLFSPRLKLLKEGDKIKFLGPHGFFTLPEDDKPIVMVSAGTGITPFISYLKSLKSNNDKRKLTILCSNKKPETILYEEELEELRKDLNLEIIHTITRPTESTTEWSGLEGRIDKEKILSLDIDSNSWFYLCGPTPMVATVQGILINLGVQMTQIKTEKYGRIQA